MNATQLAACTGASLLAATKQLPFIEIALAEFEINTVERQTAFLAQVGHECEGFVWSAEIWGPTDSQNRYERDFTDAWPSSPAQAKEAAYATNRLAYTLGNTEVGDGRRFKGHGWIQVTGRTNHAAARDQLRRRMGTDAVPDFEATPAHLELPEWAAMSAANFWFQRGCNELADLGQFETITRRINGGLNGYPKRLVLWEKAKRALGQAL